MKTIILSAIVTVLTLFDAACTSSAEAPAKSPIAASSPSAKPEFASKTPEDWILVQNEDYIPVIDDLSRELQSARKAFLMKDPGTAAADLRATADLLSKETGGATPKAKEKIDLTMKQLSSLAADLDGKKSVDAKQFDAVIASVHHADLEREWVVQDESTWYPYISEPDLHFKNARQSFVAHDYEKAAQEIRKGEAFVKLQAGYTRGDAKKALNSSALELETLAAHIQKGTATNFDAAGKTFQRADRALAESHQLKASESWSKKEIGKAGYEMKAGALFLEQSEDWAGDAKSDVSAMAKETKILGGTLIAGGEYAVDEVRKGIDDLGKAISNANKMAQPSK